MIIKYMLTIFVFKLYDSLNLYYLCFNMVLNHMHEKCDDLSRFRKSLNIFKYDTFGPRTVAFYLYFHWKLVK